jgi:hypothetical protein
MTRKLIHLNSMPIPLIALTLVLSVGFCLDACAQTRAVQKETTTQSTKLMATSGNKMELNRFCDASTTKSSKRGKKTTYSCQSKPSGSANSIQANPQVQRSEINCSYSESGGVTKWLGCTCKENQEGNCNQFISNCAEAGDEVGGNSGGASCGPSGG